MKVYGTVNILGDFWPQRTSDISEVVWASDDEGRILYDSDNYDSVKEHISELDTGISGITQSYIKRSALGNWSDNHFHFSFWPICSEIFPSM